MLKSIFAITELDFGHITEPVRGGIIIKNPTEKTLYILYKIR